jgi:hypothetical protein
MHNSSRSRLKPRQGEPLNPAWQKAWPLLDLLSFGIVAKTIKSHNSWQRAFQTVPCDGCGLWKIRESDGKVLLSYSWLPAISIALYMECACPCGEVLVVVRCLAGHACRSWHTCPLCCSGASMDLLSNDVTKIDVFRNIQTTQERFEGVRQLTSGLFTICIMGRRVATCHA